MSLNSKRKVFIGVWLVCGLMLMSVQLFVRDNSSFMGIAGSRAQEISTSISAKIKQIHVIAGQNVKKGDLLIELENPELDIEMSKIKVELDYFKDQRRLLSEVVRLGAEQDSRIVNLEKQLTILSEQKDALMVFSSFDGKIEAIHRRKGEFSQPLLPILTLQEMTPTKVHGFIHESIIGEITVGSMVEVTASTAQGEKRVQGKVLSIGSSIVPFPERLLRDIARPMWGREVVIEIPEKNGLILGERVFVAKSVQPSTWFNSAHAEPIVRKETSNKYLVETQIVKIPLSNNQDFEASGVVWLDSIQRYLVVSDGKSTARNPQMALVDKSGTVTRVFIPGMESVRDLESVGLDSNGELYVLSSLGKDKAKHKGISSKKNMIKLHREGMSFSKGKEVSLGDVLQAALKTSNDANLSFLMRRDELKIDVEGMAFEGQDRLLLGLRRPVKGESQAVILSVEGVQAAFTNRSVGNVKVEYLLNLKHSTGEVLGVSDLALCGQNLYIAAAPAEKKGRLGAIYRLNRTVGANSLVKIQEYAQEKPEGVDCHAGSSELAVTFDHGGQGSHMIIYDVQN